MSGALSKIRQIIMVSKLLEKDYMQNSSIESFTKTNIVSSITKKGSWLFQDQKGFPAELFQVKMYALTTDMPKRVQGTRSKMQSNLPGLIH